MDVLPRGSADLGGDMDEEEKLLQEQYEEILRLDLGDLDVTTDDIGLENVSGDLEKFQQDALVQDALSKGVDLKNYARQIELDLKDAENASIADYLRESESVAALHFQIKDCDSILERMEAMLGKFQNDLGTISSEIKGLQDKSLSMSVKLKNRTVGEHLLSTYVRNAFIPPDLVATIIGGEINDAYIFALKQVRTHGGR